MTADKRLQVRIRMQDYEKVEDAAEKRGLSVSAFVRSAILEIAERTMINAS